MCGRKKQARRLMIMNDEHRFAFVHIPKCAGTTMRQALAPFDDASARYFDRAVANHPVMGPLDHAHIPLAVLKEHFPEDFEKLESYASFTFVRDPFARFPSSLHERITQRDQKTLAEIGKDDVAKEIDSVLKALANHPHDAPITDPTLVHFSRQKDYVFLASRQVVRSIYTIKDVNAVLTEISAITGASLVLDGGKNRRVYHASPIFEGVQNAITRPIEMALPRKVWKPVFNQIKNIFLATGIMHQGANPLEDLPNGNDIKSFISEFYAEDIKLYETVAATRHTAPFLKRAS